MTTPAQDTVDRLKPYVKELLGTTARDQARQALADTEAIRDAVPGQIAAELDLQVPPRIDAGMDEHAATTASTVAGWTADAVGGRNLIPDSHFLDASPLPGWKATYGTHSIVDSNYRFEVTSDTNLLAVRLELEVDIAAAGVYTYTLFVKSPRRYEFRQLVNASIIAVQQDSSPDVNGYIRLSLTFDCPEPGSTTLRAYLIGAQTGDVVLVDWVKLERGYEATPWTPAPEDAATHVQAGNPLSSFPSPFPAHDPALALRVDNSVGTRVFVGDTMIHGDTGWRDVTSTYEENKALYGNHTDLENGGRILIRRVGDLGMARFVGQMEANRSWGNIYNLTNTWLPLHGDEMTTIHSGARLGIMANWLTMRSAPDGVILPAGETTTVTWRCDPSRWPTSLPGTPA